MSKTKHKTKTKTKYNQTNSLLFKIQNRKQSEPHSNHYFSFLLRVRLFVFLTYSHSHLQNLQSKKTRKIATFSRVFATINSQAKKNISHFFCFLFVSKTKWLTNTKSTHFKAQNRDIINL